ncbi:MAG: bifunctional nuclease family protein [Fimbriiglobus sp.]
MPIAMKLRRIILSQVEEAQHLILKEIEGERSFPIVVGLFEATCIDRRVRGVESPRPLTHDLIVNAIEALGGDLEDVVISALEESTYYAQLRVRQAGELISLDARPSDAIAIAVTYRLPIYVNEEVVGDSVEGE